MKTINGQTCITVDMWLVYLSDSNKEYLQPWQDLVSAGTLIDPDTGDDMEIIGWTVNPK